MFEQRDLGRVGRRACFLPIETQGLQIVVKRFARGRGFEGLLPGLDQGGLGLFQVFGPTVMVGQHTVKGVQLFGKHLFDRVRHFKVQRLAFLGQNGGIGRLLGQGMFEIVFQLLKALPLQYQLSFFQIGQTVVHILGRTRHFGQDTVEKIAADDGRHFQ